MPLNHPVVRSIVSYFQNLEISQQWSSIIIIIPFFSFILTSTKNIKKLLCSWADKKKTVEISQLTVNNDRLSCFHYIFQRYKGLLKMSASVAFQHFDVLRLFAHVLLFVEKWLHEFYKVIRRALAMHAKNIMWVRSAEGRLPTLKDKKGSFEM